MKQITASMSAKMTEKLLPTDHELIQRAAVNEVELGSLNQEHGKTHFPGQRGRQKRPTKVMVTMRFSPEILAFFKTAGEGWQTRINNVLRDYVAQHHSDQEST